MSARLVLALFLVVVGFLVLLAHPALYSRLWTYGLVAGFAVCTALALVFMAGHRNWPIARPVSIGLLSLVAATLVSVGVNEDTDWLGLWLPASQWGFLCMGAWIAGDRLALRCLGGSLVIGAVAVGVYAILQYYRLDPLPPVTAFGDERIVAVFENPNFLGNFAACALPLALLVLFQGSTNWQRIVGVLGVGAIYAGGFLAGSRGGWVAGIAGVLVLGAGVARSVYLGRIRLHWPSLVVLVGLLVALTFLLSRRPVVESRGDSVTMSERILSTRHIIAPYVESEMPVAAGADSLTPQIEVRDFTVNHRYFIWEVTWAMIQTRPLVGIGYGNYQKQFTVFRDSRREDAHFQSLVWTQQQEDTPYAHNEYLHLWVESGVLGLVAFLALVGLAGWEMVKMAWCDASSYLWAGLGIITVMLVHSLVSYPLRLPLNGMIFWLALGILVGSTRLRQVIADR